MSRRPCLGVRGTIPAHPPLYKILVANSAIVLVGAVIGTIVTVWHVRRFPDDIHYDIDRRLRLCRRDHQLRRQQPGAQMGPGAAGPASDARSTTSARGQSEVRVALGENSDDRFDRLADTFNRMLDEQETNAQRMQQLSRQILQAQEDERQRLARELHDEAAQALTSLLVHLRLLERAQTPEEAQSGCRNCAC